MKKQIYIVKAVNEFGGIDFFCDMYATLEEAEKGFASDLPEYKILEIRNI